MGGVGQVMVVGLARNGSEAVAEAVVHDQKVMGASSFSL